MSIYKDMGEAVFVHECEIRRHSITIGWRPGDPSLDLNSMPMIHLPGGKTRMCHCGKDYTRVTDLCPPESAHLAVPHGEKLPTEHHHNCHPIAGHVERSDDPTKGLIPTPEPDPLKLLQDRRDYVRWVIETQHAIADFERQIQAGKFENEWHREDCQLSLAAAQENLRRGLQSPVAKVVLNDNGHKDFKIERLPKPIEVAIDLSPRPLVGDPEPEEEPAPAPLVVDPAYIEGPHFDRERNPSPARRARSFVRWWFTGER